MSTAGLGQGTQVFDFTGIGKQGLMLDDRKEAKEQAAFERNKDLYDPISADGIRDVDAAYINAELENAMQLSAQAAQTNDPADVQAARNARSKVSSLTAESVAARNSAFETMAEVRKTAEYQRDPARFEQHLREQQQSTAMNSNNGGKVGENIIFQAPTFYNLDKGLTDFVDKDSQTILRGSYESDANASTDATGAGEASSVAAVNVQRREQLITDNYQSQMVSNPDFKNAIEAQVMSEMYGTTDLDTQQVARFNETRELGQQLRAKYSSVEELLEDNQFKNDPIARANAEKAFNLENDVYNRGQEMYREAILGKAVKGQQTSSKTSEAQKDEGSGKYGKSDFAVNSGNTIESVLGNVSLQSIPDDLQNRIAEKGSMLGYSSTPDMKVFKSGSGTEGVIANGLIASKNAEGKTQYFVVEYKPSPDIIAKVERGEDVSDLLQKMDANLVPLQKSRSRIPEIALSYMKAKADAQVAEDVL
jgi:hypothetical protein